MDTIIKKNSLFVGVGAAHLPGHRGIIELLRKMGYTLRPIQMTDRDAAQKEVIDKMKVPVNFTTQTADDGFFTVDMPGPLFKLSDEYQQSGQKAILRYEQWRLLHCYKNKNTCCFSGTK